MNFDLIQQLKDVGFPFVEFSVEEMGLGLYIRHGVDIDGKTYYVPDLSELIKACGEDFYAVIKGRGTSKGLWFASNITSPEFHMESAKSADTPEEAVAKLWLMLNGNKEIGYKCPSCGNFHIEGEGSQCDNCRYGT